MPTESLVSAEFENSGI